MKNKRFLAVLVLIFFIISYQLSVLAEIGIEFLGVSYENGNIKVNSDIITDLTDEADGKTVTYSVYQSVYGSLIDTFDFVMGEGIYSVQEGVYLQNMPVISFAADGGVNEYTVYASVYGEGTIGQTTITPSTTREITSLSVNGEPAVINGTEISLKVPFNTPPDDYEIAFNFNGSYVKVDGTIFASGTMFDFSDSNQDGVWDVVPITVYAQSNASTNYNLNIEEDIPSDSEISPTEATFDKNQFGPIHINMQLYDNELVDINIDQNGEVRALQPEEGTVPGEYVLSGNEVRLEESFLSGLPLGTYELTFDFDNGADPVFTLTVVNTDPTILAAPVINFTTSESYVQFTTEAQVEDGPQYDQFDRVNLNINGMLPEKLLDGQGSDFFQGQKVQLVKMDGETEIPIMLSEGETNGSMNNMFGNPQALNLGMRLEQGNSLDYSSTYRIKFTDPILKIILADFENIVYLDEGMDINNLTVEINSDNPEAQPNNARATGSLYSESAGAETTPAIMEIGGDSRIGATENYIAYDIDFSKGFTDVKKVSLIATGNADNPESIDDSEDLNTLGVLTGSAITVTYTAEADMGMNTFTVDTTLTNAQDFSEETTLESYGAVANEYYNIINMYQRNGDEWNNELQMQIDYSQWTGSFYMYVYNSSDELIGWKYFNDIDWNRLYSNPEFQWWLREWDDQLMEDVWEEFTPETNESSGLPYLTGMNNWDPEKYLRLVNSGSNERIILQGTLEYENTTPAAFYISYDTNGNGGTYSTSLNFTNHNDQNFQGWEITDQNWNNNQIPVNRYTVNTITLLYSYTDTNGDPQEGSIEFEWHPDPEELKNDLLGSFDYNNGQGTIGLSEDYASLTMRTHQFMGDYQDLKLYLYHNDDLFQLQQPEGEEPQPEGEEPPPEGEEPPPEGEEPQEPEYAYTTGSAIYVTLTPTGMTTEEDEWGNQQTYITFEVLEGDTFTLDTYSLGEGEDEITLAEYLAENQHTNVSLYSRLVYDNGTISVERDREDNINDVNIDGTPPDNFWGRFKGQATDEEDELLPNTFKVKAEFNDYIDIDSLQGNVVIEITKQDSIEDEFGNKQHFDTTTTAAIVLIEGYHNEYDNENDPYRSAVITFTADEQFMIDSWKREISISGVSDLYGNEFSDEESPLISDFWIDSHIRTKLLDADGNAITDAELRLVQEIPLPSEESDEWRWNQRSMQINKKGIINTWLMPGTYYGYQVSQQNSEGEWIDTPVYIEITIPWVDQDLQYYEMDDLQLPAPNVSGSTLRESDREFTEELIFVEKTYYDQYLKDIMDHKKDKDMMEEPPPEGEDPGIYIEGEEPYDPGMDFGRIMEILQNFYIKEVETNKSGEFELYLDPGESGKLYTLVGKKLGEGLFIPPVTEVTFLVAPTGYTFATPVEFPPPVIQGTLEDESGNPIPYAMMEINQYEDDVETGNHFMAEADKNGFFEIYIDQTGHFKIEMIRSGWGNRGTAKMLVFGAEFDVVDIGTEEEPDLEASGLKNYLGEAVDDFDPLIAPNPNVTVKVGIGRDSGTLVQSEKQFYALQFTADDEEAPYYLQNIHLPSENGTYEMFVPQGDYTINEIQSHEINIPSREWQSPSEDKFITVTKVGGDATVINETVATDENTGQMTASFDGYSFTVGATNDQYEIDLAGYFDTVIQLIDDSSIPMANVGVNIENRSNWNWYHGNTGSDGKAYFYIGVTDDTEGEVDSQVLRVQGYDENHKWYNLEEEEPPELTSEAVAATKYMLMVTENNTPTNKASKVITIIKPNFQGQVFDSDMVDGEPVDSDAYLEYGWLDIQKMRGTTKDDQEEWYGTGLDEEGNFQVSLEKEGKYIVNSAGSWDVWFEIAFRFDVVLSGGKYILVYPEGHASEGEAIPMPMKIGRPTPNFSGYLFKRVAMDGEDVDIENSTPYAGYDGSQEWHQEAMDRGESGVWLQVRETLESAGVEEEFYNNERWRYERWVEVEEDGSFGSVLDASKDYEAFAVQTPRRWYNFAEPFPVTVEEGYTNYIYPPAANFSGTVLTFDGTFEEAGINVEWGGIGLEKTDGTGWEWVEMDPDGSFGRNLEVGAKYRINDINYEIRTDGVDEWGNPNRQHFNFRINKTVTIGENSLNITLRPNFKGIISGLEINTNNLWQNSVGVNLRQELANDDPNYEDFKRNPWQYETWGNGTYDDEAGEVVFYAFLQDYTTVDGTTTIGNDYTLMRVHDSEINETFTLAQESGVSASGDGVITYTPDADAADADYDDGTYLFELDFESNVTGYVAEAGARVADAWMNLQKIVEHDPNDMNYDPWMNNQWFGTQTNENGEFGLKLGDGNYRIDGYHTQGHWEGFQWVHGQWVQVGYEFKVIDGELCDSSGNPMEQIILDTNVQGKVMKLTKDGEYELVTDHAWISVWPTDENGNIDWSDWSKSMWANTDNTGIFKMTLAPGKYMVTDVGGHDFWMRVDLPFEIDANGTLVVDEAYMDGDYFIVKPIAPNVVGTAYKDQSMEQTLNRGWVLVKPKSAEEHDWSSVRWFDTASDGSFSFSLAKGDWKIIELGNWNFWQRVNIPFNVGEGDVITPLAGGMTVSEEDGSISIYPPEPNVQGVVYDKEGNISSSRAWITIKPASASDHDWSNAMWTEFRYYEEDEDSLFKLNLEPGDYKIVDCGGWYFWYRPDTTFTVNQDQSITSDDYNEETGRLEIRPPTPNVTGIVYGTFGEEERPINRGWINVARYVGDTQVTMDGYTIPDDEWKDPYSDMYWHHTDWAETDESGNFSFKLDSGGTYRIVSVGGEGIWYQPNTEITIVGDETYDIEVREPGPNVTITITDLPEELLEASDGWLDIYVEKEGFKHFMPANFVEKTETDFVFEATLRDGDYTIAFFGTPNGGLELEVDLEVDGSTELEISIQNESGKCLVKGTVTRDGTQVTEQVWVAIEGTVEGETVKKKVQTNSNGEFTFKLKHNTVWTLKELVPETEGFILVEEGAVSDLTITEEQTKDWTIEINDIYSEE
jgi:hypothetical protein